MITPNPTMEGSKIVIWSPSFPGASRYPRRLERSQRALEQLGFEVQLAPNSLGDIGIASAPPKELANEFHQLLMDDSVSCVIGSLGGWTSIRILEYLDFNLIRKARKQIVGYSDISVILLAISKMSCLITYHGPNALSEFGEYGGPFSYTSEWFLNALKKKKEKYLITPSSEWTDEYLEWEKNDVRCRYTHNSSKWRAVSEGVGKGRIICGAYNSILSLIGTPYCPDFRGAILFLDCIAMSQDELLCSLTSLDLKGVFDKVEGVAFARLCRPRRTPGSQESHSEIIESVIGSRDFPVCCDVDFGHTDPMITIPIGGYARLSVEECVEIEILK